MSILKLVTVWFCVGAAAPVIASRGATLLSPLGWVFNLVFGLYGPLSWGMFLEGRGK